MASSTLASRTASSSRSGGVEPGSSSGRERSVSLTPISPAAPRKATAVTGEIFAALLSCPMPEALTSGDYFEEKLQQFTTAAIRSGWQTTTSDNFALGL